MLGSVTQSLTLPGLVIASDYRLVIASDYQLVIASDYRLVIASDYWLVVASDYWHACLEFQSCMGQFRH